MKRRLMLPLIGFVFVLALHGAYSVLESKRLTGRWATIPGVNALTLYFERGQYFVGASYALTIGFSIYALLRFTENGKRGFAGLFGGVTMTGVLYVAVCFLIGCCGSPMLAVYLTLFGSSFIGLAKPVTFLLTLVSVVLGYIWMERQAARAADCCEIGAECNKP